MENIKENTDLQSQGAQKLRKNEVRSHLTPRPINS